MALAQEATAVGPVVTGVGHAVVTQLLAEVPAPATQLATGVFTAKAVRQVVVL